METQALIETRRVSHKRALAAWAAGPVAAMWLLSAAPAPAQTTDMQKILERLDRLEEQNKALAAEVRSLRDRLEAARAPEPPPSQPAAASEPPAAAAQAPSTEERLQVQESRTAELAASKVGASQRFPLRLSGMVLLNSFLNSAGSGAQEYTTIAVPGGTRSGGGSVRQSILGLDYSGPTVFGDGKVSGSLRMDFWSGSAPINMELRLRTATIGIDWKDRSFLVGFEKPLISPRDPESMAQVAVSPLSGAGNLWLWLPQARFEQDFHFTGQTGVRAQVAAVGTHEVVASPASPYEPDASTSAYIEPMRPGIEARVELFTGGEDRRLEVASSVHHSVSHVVGQSIASDVLSFDWLARPLRQIEFTGTFYTGQNIAPLGTGAIRQGFVAFGPGRLTAVQGMGGWGQLKLRASSRLWFNLFTGQQDDRNSQLAAGAIGKNLAYGANLFYRLAPNVLASFEASQTRTNYLGSGVLLNNHYDLALGYLF
jgi:hypothetical protein